MEQNAVNNKIAGLRNMLWQMEVEFGLEKLSQPQKDVFYAACLAADDNQLVLDNRSAPRAQRRSKCPRLPFR
jgi:hypothetical protein